MYITSLVRGKTNDFKQKAAFNFTVDTIWFITGRNVWLSKFQILFLFPDSWVVQNNIFLLYGALHGILEHGRCSLTNVVPMRYSTGLANSI
jgi:hypothetical protein